jgi:S1-C subfamily serine protease
MWPSVVKNVMPAVVRIEVTGDRGAKAVGAGFILDGGELISTCWHVAHPDGQQPDTITVRYHNGQTNSVTVARDLRREDLTLLHNTPKSRVGLSVGSFSQVEVGEPIIFIGFPQSTTLWTVHSGIVSAKGAFSFPDFPMLKSPIDTLQLDATVHFGHSGGPVLRSDGTVVGFIDAKVTYTTYVGQALRRVLPQRQVQVMIGGIDPIQLIAQVVDELEKSRSMGLGYAFSAEYVQAALGTGRTEE